MNFQSSSRRSRGRILLQAIAAAATLAFVAPSCETVGPDYEAHQPEAGDMSSWNGRLDDAITSKDLDPEVLAHWWTTFEDQTLTSLVERATDANLDIRTALSQLRVARAQLGIAGSTNLPNIGASAGANRAGRAGGADTLYSSGLDASWEIDLFGGHERTIEAAEADLEAANEARHDVLVSVLAEVALNYADLRTQQRRLALTEENLHAQEQHKNIVQVQFEAGVASQLDLDRLISNVEQTRAAIPALKQQISQSMNRLSVLCGENPGSLNAELEQWKALTLPSIEVAVGVPAQVLRRRPDVRRAERILAAETARVGVAISELYPKLSLNGSIGLESNSSSNLFDSASSVWSLGPRLQWNLFDGGRTRQKIEIQNAVQEQALIAYEAVVLKSLEEVQNAITAFGQEQIRYVALNTSSQSAVRATALAQARFDAGETDLLDVLDAQRSRLSASDEEARSEGQIVANLIRLYKALGGGWTAEPPVPTEAQ